MMQSVTLQRENTQSHCFLSPNQPHCKIGPMPLRRSAKRMTVYDSKCEQDFLKHILVCKCRERYSANQSGTRKLLSHYIFHHVEVHFYCHSVQSVALTLQYMTQTQTLFFFYQHLHSIFNRYTNNTGQKLVAFHFGIN